MSRVAAQRLSARASREAHRWNLEHGTGTSVILTRDDGSELTTRTRSGAYVASGRAVVHVEGVSGFYLLSRVRALGAP